MINLIKNTLFNKNRDTFDDRMINLIKKTFSKKNTGAFDEIEDILNRNKEISFNLNFLLKEQLNHLEKILNKQFQTRGKIDVYDKELCLKRKVPPIHIFAPYHTDIIVSNDLNTDTKIDINFNFKQLQHIESFYVSYKNTTFYFSYNNKITTNIHELSQMVEISIKKRFL